MKDKIAKIIKDYGIDIENEDKFIEDIFKLSNALRTFGMVRWHDNVDEDVACVSIEKAKEYVEKYNKISGKEDCYVDEDIWLLLNEA